MRRYLIPLSLSVLLSACYGVDDIDRIELSDFRPTSPDSFRYAARTTLFYGPGIDTWAENARLRWLGAYLDIFAMCPAGYRLMTRDAILRDVSPLGYPNEEIVYQGRCQG